MDIREEFETWIDDYGWSIQPDSTGLVGRYEDDRTQLAWEAWQASRDSINLIIHRRRGIYPDADDYEAAIEVAGLRTEFADESK